MGLLSNILGAAVDIVATPVELARDVFGDDEESHTLNRLKKAGEKLENAADDATKGDII